LAGEPHLLVGDFNSLAPGARLEAMSVLRHALHTDAERRALGRPLHGLPTVTNILPPVVLPFLPLLAWLAQNRVAAHLCDALVGAYVPRRVVRRVRAEGYVDCYAALHPDAQSEGFTCPLPTPAGRIDYIFASPDLAASLESCEVLTDGPGSPVSLASDHRPVLARLRLGA
jgi:endonuclease/exonuclease/phosphatase family metal-dependent hydrolase